MRADVQQADAAHLQQVLQQLGAAALDRGLVDAVQVHRVVGHQAVAARDQLQPELALAQARLAGDHHAQPEDVHEHAVHRGALGEMLGQVGAQHVDHEGRRLVRGEHRDLRRARTCDSSASGATWLSVSTSTGGSSVTMREMRRAQSSLGRVGEVGDLALAQDLDAVGVDVVEVADQVGAGAGGAHRDLVEAPLRGAQAGHPFPLAAGPGGLRTGRRR